MRLLLPILALVLAVPTQAAPVYEVIRRDWFSLSTEEQVSGPAPVGIEGGPQNLGSSGSYSWDIAANPGELHVWVKQTCSGSTSLQSSRAGRAVMTFNDVVFSDGSGSGGNIQVRVKLALQASVQHVGGVFSTLEISGSGGLWGRWHAQANASAPPSSGVFAGLDHLNAIDGVFQSNLFTVSADQPVSVQVLMEFLGSAQCNGFNDVVTEADGILNPSEVFELPPGYTANSVEAGIVNNQLATSAVPTPGAGPTLSLSAFPNPFQLRTHIAFELETPGEVEISVFDVRGRLVRELFRGFRSAGAVETTWDGTGADGGRVPSGIYFARVSTGGEAESRTLSLLR